MTQRFHRFNGENEINGYIEVFANAKGEVQTRIVFFAFQIANRLEIDADHFGQLLPRDASLVPQKSNAIIYLPGFHTLNILHYVVNIQQLDINICRLLG